MWRWRALVWTVAIIVIGMMAGAVMAQSTPASVVTDVCPENGLQTRAGEFQPGGIILTAFDRANIWVYDIDRNRRYPLPETAPCLNCRLSRDARWITYFNDATNAYNKMRLDGTQRSMLVEYAGDVEWWSPDMLLVWTPGHAAYLRPEAEDRREYLSVDGVMSVQPGGRWGVALRPEGDGFARSLVNLELRGLVNVSPQELDLGVDVPYFDNASWSPDGQWLAYSAPGAFDDDTGIAGGELFGVRPGDSAPTQWTDLTATYGAARINGRNVGGLSWSPDSTRVAFWVTELLGPNPEADLGNAVIHVYDTRAATLQRYCAFSTTEHTPNPPRLVWSPDGTHLAFGGNVPADELGYLLLALDTQTGVFTSLSDGIYPALGTADVIAWGLPPQ